MADSKFTPTFYVYRHVRHDNNEVFYIGKGTYSQRNRWLRAHSRTGRNWIWKAIVAKCGEYGVEIMMEFTDEAKAFAKEKEMIALYGRKDLSAGTLANLSDGGDGAVGYRMTEEQRHQTSERQKGVLSHMYGKHLSEETKRKMSERLRGRTPTEEHKRKAGQSHVGIKRSQESKQKQSASRMGMVVSEETKQKISRTTRGRILTTSHRQKIGNAHRGKIISEEARAKMSAAKKGRTLTAEHKEKVRQAALNQWERQKADINFVQRRHNGKFSR